MAAAWRRRGAGGVAAGNGGYVPCAERHDRAAVRPAATLRARNRAQRSAHCELRSGISARREGCVAARGGQGVRGFGVCFGAWHLSRPAPRSRPRHYALNHCAATQLLPGGVFPTPPPRQAESTRQTLAHPVRGTPPPDRPWCARALVCFGSLHVAAVVPAPWRLCVARVGTPQCHRARRRPSELLIVSAETTPRACARRGRPPAPVSMRRQRPINRARRCPAAIPR